MKNALLIAMLAAGCQGTGNLLGGQEGEPLDIAPPPAAEPVADADGGATCIVTASCSARSWCADYSQVTEPDSLQAECEDAGGTYSNEPCDVELNQGFCQDLNLDPCTVVWLFDSLSVSGEDFCFDNGLEFVTPRG